MAICSDATNSRENISDYTDGGIAYGLRRTAIERAKTAREAVEIIGELVHAYGYNASGRSYQVAERMKPGSCMLYGAGIFAPREYPIMGS